tara:strand:+ start:1481 stop:1702 length:222 start_codon:yes stop_codon:yes gene_type:complete
MKEENESIALPSKVLPVQLTCGEYFYRTIWDLIFCEQDLLTRINIGFFQKINGNRKYLNRCSKRSEIFPATTK